MATRLGDICNVDWGNTAITKKSYVEDGEYLAVSATGGDGKLNHYEHEADVCDGCLSTIDDSDDPNGSNTVHRIEYNRYAPDVESYDGKRSKKNEFTIYKAKTYEDWEKIQKSMAKYSAMTPKQRNDDYIKKIVPALRKSNMRDYGRYVIDKKGKYIGDKELAEKYGG